MIETLQALAEGVQEALMSSEAVPSPAASERPSFALAHASRSAGSVMLRSGMMTGTRRKLRNHVETGTSLWLKRLVSSMPVEMIDEAQLLDSPSSLVPK